VPSAFRFRRCVSRAWCVGDIGGDRGDAVAGQCSARRGRAGRRPAGVERAARVELGDSGGGGPRRSPDRAGPRAVAHPHRLAVAERPGRRPVGRGGGVLQRASGPARRGSGWRVRVVLRGPTGSWSRPILVAAPRHYVEDVDCGVDDAGNVAVAWTEGIGARVRGAAVNADGRVEAPRTLGRDPESPDVEMAPDGTAIVGFATGGPGKRRLSVVEHRPGSGWSSPAQVGAGETVQGPQLAVGAAGRTLLGWNAIEPWAVRLATGSGTALTASTLVATRYVRLATLVAGSRGDAIATYYTYARAAALRTCTPPSSAPVPRSACRSGSGASRTTRSRRRSPGTGAGPSAGSVALGGGRGRWCARSAPRGGGALHLGAVAPG
jgi:hypothetical protein